MDSSVVPMKNGGFEVFILMEYCSGGQLIDYMNERLDTRLTEDQVLTIFSDICEAIVLMHSQNPCPHVALELMMHFVAKSWQSRS